MKIEFEKILLALVVMMMLTLGVFHSCKDSKEQPCHVEYVTYSVEYDSIELIDEYNDFCVIRYNTGDTLINIYASFEDMTFIDSLLYSMENAGDTLVDYLMVEFSEEVRYRWSDYLKQYVLYIE